MWESIKDNWFVIAALMSSVPAYLIGLLVSHLKRDKKWLSFSVNTRSIISVKKKELTAEYRGERVNSLESHEINIKNIGNRPLEDIPVRVIIDSSSRVVDYEFTRPIGVSINDIVLTGPEFRFTVDLLNQNEGIIVNLNVADSIDSDVAVVVRKAGVVLKGKSIPSDSKLLKSIQSVVNGDVFGKSLGAIVALLLSYIISSLY